MTPKYLLLIYRDKRGEWRWRLSQRNSRVIADGGESYATRSNAMRAARRLREIAAQAEVKAQVEAHRGRA